MRIRWGVIEVVVECGALVGKGASSELWADLAGASGGRAMMVRRPIEAARFALAAAHGGDAGRVRNARVAIA